jgi:hypothetical protein
LRSEYAQTKKQSIFPGDKPVAVLGKSARVFPPYRSRLHIAVIGNFIFIVIRTAATWRARSMGAVFT